MLRIWPLKNIPDEYAKDVSEDARTEQLPEGKPALRESFSLQLSFASMAGLFCVSGALHRALSDRLLPAGMKLSRPRRRVRTFFIATTASSVGAMVFTVPLTALHFGSISLIAPVTNLLILWLLPAAFIGCYARFRFKRGYC